jgi:cold shock CspA family protein
MQFAMASKSARRAYKSWRKASDRPDPVADELHEVDIYGIVTTMTSDECRALAARLLKITGDAPAAAPASPLVDGVIRHYNADRGHGFVRRDSGGEGIFFHRRVAEGASDEDLVSGRRVRFEVGIDSGRYEGAPIVTRLTLAE